MMRRTYGYQHGEMAQREEWRSKGKACLHVNLFLQSSNLLDSVKMWSEGACK